MKNIFFVITIVSCAFCGYSQTLDLSYYKKYRSPIDDNHVKLLLGFKYRLTNSVNNSELAKSPNAIVFDGNNASDLIGKSYSFDLRWDIAFRNSDAPKAIRLKWQPLIGLTYSTKPDWSNSGYNVSKGNGFSFHPGFGLVTSINLKNVMLLTPRFTIHGVIASPLNIEYSSKSSGPMPGFNSSSNIKSSLRLGYAFSYGFLAQFKKGFYLGLEVYRTNFKYKDSVNGYNDTQYKYYCLAYNLLFGFQIK